MLCSTDDLFQRLWGGGRINYRFRFVGLWCCRSSTHTLLRRFMHLSPAASFVVAKAAASASSSGCNFKGQSQNLTRVFLKGVLLTKGKLNHLSNINRIWESKGPSKRTFCVQTAAISNRKSSVIITGNEVAVFLPLVCVVQFLRRWSMTFTGRRGRSAFPHPNFHLSPPPPLFSLFGAAAALFHCGGGGGVQPGFRGGEGDGGGCVLRPRGWESEKASSSSSVVKK